MAGHIVRNGKFRATASGAAVTLTGTVLAPHYTPLHLGLLYVPELGGAVIAAIAFGLVISRRLIHYVVLAGMIFLAAGILVKPAMTTDIVRALLRIYPSLHEAAFPARLQPRCLDTASHPVNRRFSG